MSGDLSGDRVRDGRGDGPTVIRSATGLALDAGTISAEHAKVIVRAMAESPDWVTAQQRAACEESLVRAAANRSPSSLRLLARRVLAVVLPPDAAPTVDAHESALLHAEEQRAVQASAFWIRDNHDGTMTGHFTVPTFAGSVLRKVIDTMTAPRRDHVRPNDHHAEHSGPTGPTGLSTTRGADSHGTDHHGTDHHGTQLDGRTDQLGWQHRRGLALTELIEHLPTEHLHAKNAATVVVTTRLADLQELLAQAGHTDLGHRISPGDVRRLACGARIIPAALGTSSVPIDLGRSARLFSTSQRTALATCYTQCAAEDCDRPFAWSELHHLQPWSRDGDTDLANAIPLCGTHHRMLHAGHHHTVHKRTSGTHHITFHQRT